MKSIACLIIAIPTFLVTTQTVAFGQQFPSTGHGAFDGSVIEIPEATSSLPSVSGQGPELSLGSSSNPAPDTTNIGSYQTVMDGSQIVQAPGTTPRQGAPTLAPVGPPQLPSQGPIVIQPAQQQVVPAAQAGSPQVIYVQQAPSAEVIQSSAQVYTPADAVFVEQGFQATGSPAFSAAAQPEAFVIEESQLPAQQVVVQQPAQQVIVQQQPRKTPHHQRVENRVQNRVHNRQAHREVKQERRAARQTQQLPRQNRRTPGARSGNRAFTTVGVSGALFTRNNGDNRDFASSSSDGFLASRDADFESLGGLDAYFGRRRLNGFGWEARYFGLFLADTATQIGGDPVTALTGLDQLSDSFSSGGFQNAALPPTAADFYNLADPHVLVRQSDINNIEFNLLRNVRPVRRASQTELLIGFRYFQFDETLLYQGLGIEGAGGGSRVPESVGFFSTAENELLGLQVGARSDYRVGRRLTLHAGIKAGAFNNTINTNQRVDFNLADGSTINPSINSGPIAGQRFDIGNQEEVTSLLAEVDLAASWQISNATRVRVGYRIIGISDVAFASEQIGTDFTDPNSLFNPDTDANLVLQGGYVGLEFAF